MEEEALILNKENVVKIFKEARERLKEQETPEYRAKELEIQRKIITWELKPEPMPTEYKPNEHQFKNFI